MLKLKINGRSKNETKWLYRPNQSAVVMAAVASLMVVIAAIMAVVVMAAVVANAACRKWWWWQWCVMVMTAADFISMNLLLPTSVKRMAN